MSKYEDSLRYKIQLDDCESSSVWADGGFSTVSGIVSDTLHVSGSKSLKFNKTGTNNANGVVYKEVSSEGLNMNVVAIDGILNLAVYVPDPSDVDSINAYLVSDATYAFTNSVGWTETTVSAGWNNVSFNLVEGVQAGDGVNWTEVRHVAAGVVMTAAGDTLDDIRLDSVWVNVPLYVRTV